MTEQSSLESIPARLMTPSSTCVTPPVNSNLQELPFGELAWEDFEKLCLRLARLENNVEHCQLYGTRGQGQEGIDLYARHSSSEKYTVYQCKRESDFSAAKIKAAVRKFRKGSWCRKTSAFVLCTKESLVSSSRADELELQARVLKAANITLIAWDSHQLSLRLKGLPEVVHDFFGREWARLFCGDEAASRLSKRLDVAEVAAFRNQLGAFYRHLFNNHDPGLPLLYTNADDALLPLEARYVLPDVDERRVIVNNKTADPESSSPTAELQREDLGEYVGQSSSVEKGKRQSENRRTTSYRQSIDKWLTSHERSIVLGGPGSGKSSLLRFLCLDLLRQEPQVNLLASKWGQYLPVWIPFAFWTKKVATTANGETSLRDALHDWLRSWDHEPLWNLVEQALEDDRLLLLVDGLDEYRDEYAAGKAWLRLKMFVEERGVATVVTSRPAGFERLGVTTSGWQQGHLSDFSPEQQEKLARIWFTHRAKSEDEDRAEEDSVAARIEADVASFINELRKSNDLHELARVPLLLCLLIAHKVLHVQLPRNRFKAYDDLVEYLISTHPRQRALAATAGETPSEIDDRDLKAVFAYLAYEIHSRFGEGIIEQSNAEDIVARYLRDDNGIFGFDSAKARRVSRDVVSIGEGTLGLLVKRSQVELGFFHRALQEYLAAYHLATLSSSDQLNIVQERCVDPQWHEIILSLLYITRSTEAVTSLVKHIIDKKTNILDRYDVEQLLGEVAFGDFNLSVSVAKELARANFARVETESWIPHRERLLENVIDGLRSARTKEMVGSKLKTWIPDRTRWTREAAFRAMRSWLPADDVKECLLQGLRDEDSSTQRTAGASLSYLFGGDEATGERVAAIAWSEDDRRVRAAAIECLLQGWPNHEKLEPILDAARTSVFPRLRLVAIAGRVRRGVHTNEDCAELFQLGRGDVGIDYHWRDLLVASLAQGWAGSVEVKKECFDAIEQSRSGLAYSRFFFDDDIAKAVLLTGFRQDEDVAKYLARGAVWDHTRLDNLLPDDTEFFDLVAKNFPNHPAIVDAVDRWLVRQTTKHENFFRAALVGRTDVAKSLLLTSLDPNHVRHATKALLEGWGMQDVEVAEALTKVARETDTAAAYAGEYLPEIISDRGECRNRLLELLSKPNHRATNAVLAGLIKLGGTEGDTEVVDEVLRLPLDSDGKYPGQGHLIKGYSSDPRVRELARDELLDPYGSLGAVAAAYGNDDEFRPRILESVTPLPARLRQLIAKRLGEATDDFSLALLESYDVEADLEARVQASTSYHTRLKTSGRDIKPVLQVLQQRIVNLGHEWLKTRHAALSALLVLKRLDIMMDAQEPERGSPDKRCRIPLERGRVSPSDPLIRLVLQNWNYIRETFGDEFWFRFDVKEERDQASFWYHFSTFADEYPLPQKELIEFLEANRDNDRAHGSWALRFLSRASPRSELLKHLCMAALASSDNKFDDSYEEAFIAAELLVKNFNEDGSVWQWLRGNIKDSYDGEEEVPENIILALSEGWPDSPEFDRIAQTIDEKKQPLTYAVLLYLSCRKDTPAEVLNEVDKILFWFERSDTSRNANIVRPLVRRLRRDDELLRLMLAKLQDHPTSTEKATYTQLIVQARGTAALSTWCVEEGERQENGTMPPEIGMDATQPMFTPITHIILNAVHSARR
jgi:hypothetical protein